MAIPTELISIDDFYCKYSKTPKWNFSRALLRKFYRDCERNGFNNAFVKITGRVFIKEEEFWKSLEEYKEAKKKAADTLIAKQSGADKEINKMEQEQYETQEKNSDGTMFTYLTKRYYSIDEFADYNLQNNRWPKSVDALYNLRRSTRKNTYWDAFVKVGRFLRIDAKKFWELAEAQTKNGQKQQ